MCNNDIKYLAAERLAQIATNAEVQTVFQILVEVASQCGVTELQGRTVIDFYETLRSQKIEKGLASGADHNPQLASEMKRLWEETKSKPR